MTGATLFSEDFESDLSLWTGLGGGSHNGAIVADPLRAGNHVLTFTAIVIGGDIFNALPFSLQAGHTYRLDFEYLGYALPNSVPGNFGAFIGITEDLPGKHQWIYGTRPLNAGGIVTPDALIDDGVWRTYSWVFQPPVLPQFFGPGAFMPHHLMLEDTSLSGGVPGDSLFDNIRISAVPEPSFALPLAAALVVLLTRRRKGRYFNLLR
ncbi:MAG TPA: hypothetical protein VEX68_26160 [Bryobacteraceae bacterium]|nr:hypothetical protein [Bryobacteraceae bacterium]